MQVTKHVHAIKIPFQVPISPGKAIERFVYVYLIYGERIGLIDTGVASSEKIIFDYVRKTGRKPEEIALLLLTHSHPDHIGAAAAVREATGCTVAAHAGEKNWIEDIDLQARERPVPGFHSLVGGPVKVDRILSDKETLSLGPCLTLDVIHTPGHSRGSLSFFLREDGALISGDSIPVAGEMPIYDDVFASMNSINKLKDIRDIDILLPSWSDLIKRKGVYETMEKGADYLRRIHRAALKSAGGKQAADPLEICREVLAELGLPEAMANPLVTRTIAAHLNDRNETEMLS